MIRAALAAVSLSTLATPALAEDFTAAAEGRLRGCLLASATSPGQTDLAAKVIEARAFCGAQIKRVRDQLVAAASTSDARAAVVRDLDAEIARAVANFSGLSS